MKIQNSKTAKTFEILKKSKKFQRYISQCRNELVENSSLEKPKLSDVIDGNLPMSVETRAKQLAVQTIKDFRLPFYWLESIKTYYLSGELKMPTIPFVISLEIDDSGYKQLNLHISKSTTLEDLKQNWSFIKKFQSLIPEIEATTVNEWQYAIYEMKKAGMNKNEIIKVLEKEYNYTADTLMIDVTYSRMKSLLE